MIQTLVKSRKNRMIDVFSFILFVFLSAIEDINSTLEKHSMNYFSAYKSIDFNEDFKLFQEEPGSFCQQ